jgi:hypothetical protein
VSDGRDAGGLAHDARPRGRPSSSGGLARGCHVRPPMDWQRSGRARASASQGKGREGIGKGKGREREGKGREREGPTRNPPPARHLLLQPRAPAVCRKQCSRAAYLSTATLNHFARPTAAVLAPRIASVRKRVTSMSGHPDQDARSLTPSLTDPQPTVAQIAHACALSVSVADVPVFRTNSA